MKSIDEAKAILAKFENEDDLSVVRHAVNQVAKIHSKHLKEVIQKVNIKDFSDVEGIGFNEWAHDQQEDIEQVFKALKDRYHDLHWKLHGFNAY